MYILEKRIEELEAADKVNKSDIFALKISVSVALLCCLVDLFI